MRSFLRRRRRHRGHSLDPSLKRQVYARDGYRCQYCGDTRGPFEIDHVFPRHHGGKDNLDNLVVSCLTCNRAKGARIVRGRSTSAKIANYRRERRAWRRQQRPSFFRSPLTWLFFLIGQLVLLMLNIVWVVLMIPLRLLDWIFAVIPLPLIFIIAGSLVAWQLFS